MRAEGHWRTTVERRLAHLASWLPAAGLVALTLAIAPAHEEPGQTLRWALVLGLSALCLALLAVTSGQAPRRGLLGLLLVPLSVGVLHTLLVPAAERLTQTRDVLTLLALLVAGIAASALPRAGRPDGEADLYMGRGAAIALAILVLIGGAQLFSGWEGLPQSHPPAATFVNRNALAALLTALVPLAAPLLSVEMRRSVRWLSALPVGGGAALLVATQSRGAWLAASCGWGLAAAWIWGRGRRRRSLHQGRSDPVARILLLRARGPLLAALVVALVGAWATSHTAPPGATPVQRMLTLARPLEGTGGIRLALWNNTLAMGLSHPWIGVGPGRWSVVYPSFNHARSTTPLFGLDHQPEHAECDPLELAAELGAAAALAILLAWGAAAAASLRRGPSAESGDPRGLLACGCAAALIALLLASLTGFQLQLPATAWLTWTLIGRGWGPSSSALRPPTRVLVGLSALMLLVVGGWIGLRESRAQRSLGEALRQHAAGHCPAALVAAAEAESAAPWRRREKAIAAMLRVSCDPAGPSALAALEQALALQPHQLNLLLATGSRRLKAGRVEASAEAFEHAVTLHPGLGNAWLGLAMARHAQSDLPGAARACTRALELSPGLPGAHEFCRAIAAMG